MPRYDDQPFSPLPGRGASPTQLMQAIEFNLMTKLRVCIPATVVAWTPATPGTRPATVDVSLDFLCVRAIDNPAEVSVDQGEQLVTTTTGLLAVGPRPIRRGKPYVVPSVGGAFSMRGPIAVDTTGLYIVADRSIDSWLNEGGPVDPATDDRHDLNDGFFLPLVYHGKNTPTIPQDKHQLGPDDGTAGLEIAIADKSIAVKTEGPNANVDAAALVQLGNALGPLLAVARQTDDVAAKAAMTAWALVVETVINVIAPGTFTPANSFATTVVAGNGFGTISSGSAKVLAE